MFFITKTLSKSLFLNIKTGYAKFFLKNKVTSYMFLTIAKFKNLRDKQKCM